jgi:glycosyltransferase involved in cell wall biosynthesis
MKILHIITGLDVGGAETTLFRLASSMDPARFTSRVVSLIAPGVMGERLDKAGVPVDSLNMRRGVPSPGGLLRLVRTIRRWRPDVVQTWLYHADLAGLVAARLAFPFGGGPKVVWNIRCSYMALDEYRRLTGLTLRACAALSRFPDAVLTNSEEARRFHGELGYRPRRFEVIPNGFDTDLFRPDREARQAVRAELDIPPDAPVIGHVARFDPMKDHRTFIEGAGLAHAQVPDAVFLLAGRRVDYDNLDLARWLSQSGVDPANIRLLGERTDVARLMAAMDVHVSSSLGEALPNAVGEAMACNVPNVVTDVGDSGRLVGGTGLVVDPDDGFALAEAMVRLVREGEQGIEKDDASPRERIVNVYSLPKMVETFENLYRGLHLAPL